jgi:phosphatidylserine decarboxylase
VEIAWAGIAALAVAGAAYLLWRHVWFWRNPPRRPPPAEGLLSAADGVVVYVKRLEAGEDVIHIKQGVTARLADIVRQDLPLPRLLIGVFMSPFDVHYNRAPLGGVIDFVRHYPGHGPNMHMGAMHWRVLRRRIPLYEDSTHIIANERVVTRIDGRFRSAPVGCYVVQIAARTVSGVDSYFQPGQSVERGEIFGMIRIGSQVDVVIPWSEGMQIRVRPGDRVRAGETLLVD